MEKTSGLIATMKALSGVPSCFFSGIFGLAIYWKVPESFGMELDELTQSAFWVIIWTVFGVSLPFSLTAIVTPVGRGVRATLIRFMRYFKIMKASTDAKDALCSALVTLNPIIKWSDSIARENMHPYHSRELQVAGIGEMKSNVHLVILPAYWKILTGPFGFWLLYLGRQKPSNPRHVYDRKVKSTEV